MPDRKRKAARRGAAPKRGPRPRSTRPGFVGRDPSPVLDRYPPRTTASPWTATPSASPPRPPAPPTGASTTASPVGDPTPPGPPSGSLIRLDAAFDLDEFSSLLGQTSIRVTVPREDLTEVLRRVLEFMGFGIYVYTVTVRPAAQELLKGFLVELERVDFSSDQRGWVPFVEKGVADNPFGSGAQRG